MSLPFFPVDDSNTETQDESTSEVKSGILPNVASWTKVLEDTVNFNLTIAYDD